MSIIINNLKKKLGLRCYNIARQNYLKSVVGKLGKIVEENDKIIIYATQKLVEKNGKKIFYELRCYGMNTYYEESIKIGKSFKLDKPVSFIFNGIVFDSPVTLSSQFSKVIFKNCTFNNGLQVMHADNVTLENNKYINWTDFYSYGDSFLYGKFDKLTIKEDKFVNSYDLKKYGETKFGMNISADKVSIINSNICAESKGQINIDSKEISIINSTITGPEVYLSSDSITSGESLLKSDVGVMIENKNSDFSGNVQTPIVIYNDLYLNTNNEVISVDQAYIKLQKERQKLLQKLYNLRNYCNQVNAIELHETQEELAKKPFNKILK